MLTRTSFFSGLLRAAVVLAMAAVAIPAARAAEVDGQDETAGQDEAASQAKSVSVPMHVADFDEKVAAENGYEIRTGADGKRYSVKKEGPEQAADGAVSPQGVITGNCGYSWLYYDAIGDSRVQIKTGFHVDRPAVSYWWLVLTKDDGGQTKQNWAGGLAFRTQWGVKRTLKNMTHGLSQAYVSTSSSALLADGSVCTSGGPSDVTWVY